MPDSTKTSDRSFRNTTGENDEVIALAKACQVYIPGREDSILCYDEKERLVGFAAWQQVLDEATLLSLAVAETQRGQGMGYRLLDKLLYGWRASQVREGFLEVRSTNAAAIALYAKAGFQTINRRRNYYRCADNRYEDALMMRWRNDDCF